MATNTYKKKHSNDDEPFVHASANNYFLLSIVRPSFYGFARPSVSRLGTPLVRGDSDMIICVAFALASNRSFVAIYFLRRCLLVDASAWTMFVPAEINYTM